MPNSKLTNIALIIILVGFIASTTALIIVTTAGQARPDFETAKSYAITLVNNELYQKAYEQLDYIVNNYNLSDNEAGSLLQQMGEIAAEHLYNPRLALAAFYKLKEYYPDHPLASEVDRDIIQQLDKLGHGSQAQRLLEEEVTLGQPASKVEPSKIIAKIGDRAITVTEIEEAISMLPPQLASQFSNKQAKLQFARSYVGQQLMYEAALRAGYDERPEVKERFKDAKREVLADEYFQDKVASRVDIDPTDIEMYYEKHKSEFGGAPLDKVRGEIAEAAKMEEMSKLQQKLLEDLLEEQNVELFPENLK